MAHSDTGKTAVSNILRFIHIVGKLKNQAETLHGIAPSIASNSNDAKLRVTFKCVLPRLEMWDLDWIFIEFVNIDFILQVDDTKRTGWVERGVRQPESIADHMYRMAVMTMLISKDDGLDKQRCMKLAIVHDLAEAIVGDISPSQGVSNEDKHRQEKEAITEMTTLLPVDIGREIYELYEEYEERQTAEAKFVKDLDMFDMVSQAHEYELMEDRKGELQGFFNSTEGKFQHPEVKAWVEELNRERNLAGGDGS